MIWNRSFLVLCLLFPLLLNAQIFNEFEIPEVNWTDWDLFDGEPRNKMLFIDSTGIENTLDIIDQDYLKIIDLDGAGSPDLLLLNPENNGFGLFVIIEDQPVPVFQTESVLIEISRRSPMNPVQFKTLVYDSLGNDYRIDHYSAFIDNGSLQYALERRDLLKKGIIEIYRNMPPTQFSVSSETSLVSGPGSDTLIRDLQEGEKGYATASVKSETGEHWWQVYIQEPNYQWRMGWLLRASVSAIYQKSR